MKPTRKNIPLYVFYHIPKCAGSTFTYHIQKRFDPSEFIALYLRFTGATRFFNRQEEVEHHLNALSEAEKEKLRVIYGHQVYYDIYKLFDRPTRYLTLLRNPIDRMVSLYNDEMQRLLNGAPVIGWLEGFMPRGEGKIIPFEDWLFWRKGLMNYFVSNFNAFFLSWKNWEKKSLFDVNGAKRALDKFYFIGMVENYKNDAAFLYGKLGINKFYADQNISTQYFTLNGQNRHLRKLIMEKCSLDMEFYDYALELNKKRQKELREYWFVVGLVKFRQRFGS